MSAARPVSLRRRLWLAGLVGVGLVGLLSGLVLGAAFERSVMAAFDRRLDDDLLTLASRVAADGDRSARFRGDWQDERYARVFSGHYWVLAQPGQTLRSLSLWDASLELPDPAPGRPPAYVHLDGPMQQTLRGLTQTITLSGVDAPVQLLVASDVAGARADIAAFRLVSAATGATLAALLLLVLASQVGFGLRPLRQLARALERLRQGSDARLPTARQPIEVQALVDELNALLAHHEASVERAQRGADDLAHALKTPLAVLQQAADGNDPALPALAREQVMRMRASIDRQLAAVTVANPRRRTPVLPVARELAALLSRAQVHPVPAIVIEGSDALRFHGEPADLEDMLGNLVENACKWARRSIRVAADLAGGRLRICVEDDGPGIDAGSLEHALQRGVRLDAATPGSGLGLSIVQSLANAHGGRLTLANRAAGGLVATLELPGSLASSRDASASAPPIC